MSQTDLFLESVKQQLRGFYHDLKLTAKANQIQKARIEGYMLAGVQIGLTDNQELHAIVIDVHCEIFGNSIEQKKLGYALEYLSEEHWNLSDTSPDNTVKVAEN